MIHDHPPTLLDRKVDELRLSGLARDIGYARAQLDLLNELSNTLDCPDITREQNAQIEKVMERVRYRLLDEMRRISSVAASIPAKTVEDIEAKARIWMGRATPGTDSDLVTLGQSLCRDLTETDVLRADADSRAE